MAYGKKRDKPAPNDPKQGPYKNKMSGGGKPKSNGMNVRTGNFSSQK